MFNNKKGFTLIELLIVIAVISTLSGIVIVRMTGTDDIKNDAKRNSDMEILKDAIVAYRSNNYNDCPVMNCNIGEGSCIEDLYSFLHPFLRSIPEPDPESVYNYFSNGSVCKISVKLSNCQSYQYDFNEKEYSCIND